MTSNSAFNKIIVYFYHVASQSIQLIYKNCSHIKHLHNVLFELTCGT